MKTMFYAAAFSLLAATAVQAQSMNKTDDPKQSSPGTTGAMNNVTSTGVATDPSGVKAQQGDTSKSSPGTVGAAPGANTSSQQPK